MRLILNIPILLVLAAYIAPAHAQIRDYAGESIGMSTHTPPQYELHAIPQANGVTVFKFEQVPRNNVLPCKVAEKCFAQLCDPSELCVPGTEKYPNPTQPYYGNTK